MTLKEALDYCDTYKPNSITIETKVIWITEVDKIVYNDILSRADENEYESPSYSAENQDAELFTPSPYDGIYFYYLSAKIDTINGEYGSYNNNIALYNSLLKDFAVYYRQNHRPKKWGV